MPLSPEFNSKISQLPKEQMEINSEIGEGENLRDVLNLLSQMVETFRQFLSDFRSLKVQEIDIENIEKAIQSTAKAEIKQGLEQVKVVALTLLDKIKDRLSVLKEDLNKILTQLEGKVINVKNQKVDLSSLVGEVKERLQNF